ncbi:mismatched base pair and cruciform DNA recognition protein [Gymnopus androsaceus JB14]|uniref:Mismatched base pair and cruciform DNA recognition protein n=1 Tax=Gymnopus androsaceus JB14 TaxID=1447944 RepID=A0A6A4HKH5_9AGAR|nr:mismatched base pair and cruciform DNA recognition protein [Gymnopus androsaceus JB14]
MSSSNGPDKTSGNFHSVKGTVVDTIGQAINSTEWQKAGKEEHAKGEAETKAAETEGWIQGTVDQVKGYTKNLVGAATDDKSKQVEGNVQKTSGEAQQAANS